MMNDSKLIYEAYISEAINWKAGAKAAGTGALNMVTGGAIAAVKDAKAAATGTDAATQIGKLQTKDQAHDQLDHQNQQTDQSQEQRISSLEQRLAQLEQMMNTSGNQPVSQPAVAGPPVAAAPAPVAVAT